MTTHAHIPRWLSFICLGPFGYFKWQSLSWLESQDGGKDTQSVRINLKLLGGEWAKEQRAGLSRLTFPVFGFCVDTTNAMCQRETLYFFTATTMKQNQKEPYHL